MEPWQAFLNEIIAHPEDDGPRLIAADWLSENGQPERGEFIRVQCAIAVTPICGSLPSGTTHPLYPSCPGCDRVAVLRKRERELLDEPGDWTPGIVWPSAECFAWERGFISRIQVPADWWLANADALVRVCILRQVRLTTPPIAERVGTHRGYTPYGRAPRGRWRLPGRRREVSSGNTAAEVGEMLVRTTWRKIAFTLPPVAAWRNEPIPPLDELRQVVVDH